MIPDPTAGLWQYPSETLIAMKNDYEIFFMKIPKQSERMTEWNTKRLKAITTEIKKRGIQLEKTS